MPFKVKERFVVFPPPPAFNLSPKVQNQNSDSLLECLITIVGRLTKCFRVTYVAKTGQGGSVLGYRQFS